MAKMGKFKVSGLEQFQKELEKLSADTDKFIQSCAKELAARLLAKVIRRTPVGKYSNEVSFTADLPEQKVSFVTKSGKEVNFTAKARKKQVNFTAKKTKLGGTLRRGWTGKETEASAAAFANHLQVQHVGENYVIEISNQVPYASYVEFGHRTANHKGWVKGQFMLTISEKELQEIAPKVLERKLQKWLRGTVK
jgi:hypothetical protein